MADVFISYSRQDKDLVRALHDALKAQNRDTWVDWEDIWRNCRIANGSLTSRIGLHVLIWCREELRY